MRAQKQPQPKNMYEHQGPLSQSLDPNLGLSVERYDGKRKQWL